MKVMPMELKDIMERRSYERHGIKDCQVQYKPIRFLDIFNSTSDKYFVLDISQNGLRFVAQAELKPQTRISLTISVPALRGNTISAEGYVGWSRKLIGLPGYIGGIRFTSIEAPDRIRLNLLLMINKTETLDDKSFNPDEI